MLWMVFVLCGEVCDVDGVCVKWWGVCCGWCLCYVVGCVLWMVFVLCGGVCAVDGVCVMW